MKVRVMKWALAVPFLIAFIAPLSSQGQTCAEIFQQGPTRAAMSAQLQEKIRSGFGGNWQQLIANVRPAFGDFMNRFYFSRENRLNAADLSEIVAVIDGLTPMLRQGGKLTTAQIDVLLSENRFNATGVPLGPEFASQQMAYRIAIARAKWAAIAKIEQHPRYVSRRPIGTTDSFRELRSVFNFTTRPVELIERIAQVVERSGSQMKQAEIVEAMRIVTGVRVDIEDTYYGSANVTSFLQTESRARSVAARNLQRDLIHQLDLLLN